MSGIELVLRITTFPGKYLINIDLVRQRYEKNEY